MLDRETALCRAWAEEQRDITRIYFFGSRVWGTPRPDSDLDVAVVAQLGALIWERQSWMTELTSLLGVEVRIEEYPHSLSALNEKIFTLGLLVFSRHGNDDDFQIVDALEDIHPDPD